MSTAVHEPIRLVRSHLSDIVDRASAQPTVITRRGKPAAAVVGVDLLERYELLDEAEINRIIDERMTNAAPGIPLETVIRETQARSA